MSGGVGPKMGPEMGPKMDIWLGSNPSALLCKLGEQIFISAGTVLGVPTPSYELRGRI